MAGPFSAGTQQEARNKFFLHNSTSDVAGEEGLLGESAHGADRRPATASEVADLGKVAK
jgi:hypothetical protein